MQFQKGLSVPEFLQLYVTVALSVFSISESMVRAIRVVLVPYSIGVSRWQQ
jgi:hypothetical protein